MIEEMDCNILQAEKSSSPCIVAQPDHPDDLRIVLSDNLWKVNNEKPSSHL